MTGDVVLVRQDEADFGSYVWETEADFAAGVAACPECRVDDAQTLARFEADQVHEYLRQQPERHVLFEIQRAGVAIGTVLLRRAHRGFVVHDVYVAPEFRRQGVAGATLQLIEPAVRELADPTIEVPVLISYVLNHDPVTRHILERAGYEVRQVLLQCDPGRASRRRFSMRRLKPMEGTQRHEFFARAGLDPEIGLPGSLVLALKSVNGRVLLSLIETPTGTVARVIHLERDNPSPFATVNLMDALVQVCLERGDVALQIQFRVGARERYRHVGGVEWGVVQAVLEKPVPV